MGKGVGERGGGRGRRRRGGGGAGLREQEKEGQVDEGPGQTSRRPKHQAEQHTPPDKQHHLQAEPQALVTDGNVGIYRAEAGEEAKVFSPTALPRPVFAYPARFVSWDAMLPRVQKDNLKPVPRKPRGKLQPSNEA